MVLPTPESWKDSEKIVRVMRSGFSFFLQILGMGTVDCKTSGNPSSDCVEEILPDPVGTWSQFLPSLQWLVAS